MILANIDGGSPDPGRSVRCGPGSLSVPFGHFVRVTAESVRES
jgi:hypothetical protein